MISIHPLILLFLLQFLIAFAGLAGFLFVKYRRLRSAYSGAQNCQEEARKVQKAMEEKERELLAWKEMMNDLQEKFEFIKQSNAQLLETVTQLFPEAKKSGEYQKAMSEIEKSNKELDLCIGTLQNENERLVRDAGSYQQDINRLARQLEMSVSKDKYMSLKTRAESLELSLKKTTKELEEKTREHQNLQKDYSALEKEYNALYKNISEASAAM